MILRIKKLVPHAKIPEYKSLQASGLDLYASEEVTINPNEYKIIPTGIGIQLPEGFEAQIRPRSGLALNYGIGVLNSPGTIDSDYRGEIKIILFNFGKKGVKVYTGMRVAQLVIAKTYKADIVEGELSDTQRGTNGFGSTGD